MKAKALRMSVIGECIKECEAEAEAYRANMEACEAFGNRVGADGDLTGMMGCKACADRLRRLMKGCSND
jgi:hypothetical protein